MDCKHLIEYNLGNRKWSVSSCRAMNMTYVPSMNELDNFCRVKKHALCPFYLISFQSECLEKPAKVFSEVLVS